MLVSGFWFLVSGGGAAAAVQNVGTLARKNSAVTFAIEKPAFRGNPLALHCRKLVRLSHYLTRRHS
jgi:hypothetical protein